MMYKELEKYKTNKKILAKFVFPDKTKINASIKLDEYEAELGNLIKDFIDHKNKPFRKRKAYHDNLTELYKKRLIWS